MTSNNPPTTPTTPASTLASNLFTPDNRIPVPRVMLPPASIQMSLENGNAWAQMKAKEKLQKKQQPVEKVPIPLKGPVMPKPIPNTDGDYRKFSGLNYDQELALPMPKPPLRGQSDKVAPSTPEPKPTAHKLHKAAASPANKKRGSPENAQDEKDEKDKESEKEKKKSRVAALKSKFSLKDIGKDLRKDGPLTSLPALPHPGGGEASSDGELTPKTVVSVTPDIQKTRLYVPKPTETGVHPMSAPAKLTSNCEPSPLLSPSEIAPLHSAGVKKVSGEGFEKSFDISLFEESPTANRAAKLNNKALKLDMPKAPPSTPESVARLPAVCYSPSLYEDDRIARPHSPGEDTEAEPVNPGQDGTTEQKDIDTPDSATDPHTDADKAGQDGSAQPNVTDTPAGPSARATADTVKTAQETTTQQKVADTLAALAAKPKTDNKYPFIVSSDPRPPNPNVPATVAYYESAPLVATSSESAPIPIPMPFDHQTSMSSTEVYDPNQTWWHQHALAAHEQYNPYAYTSYGGYAPPPPLLGYQNTMSLEQQLTNQVNSLHHHITGAISKINKNSDNAHNRTLDQIMPHLDSICDALRVWNGDIARIRELNHSMSHFRYQVALMQDQIFHINQSISLLVAGVDVLQRASARKEREGDGRARGRNPHPHPHPHPQARTPVPPPAGRRATAANNKGDNNRSFTAAAAAAAGAVHESSDIDGDNVPTPVAAFRTPIPSFIQESSADAPQVEPSQPNKSKNTTKVKGKDKDTKKDKYYLRRRPSYPKRSGKASLSGGKTNTPTTAVTKAADTTKDTAKANVAPAETTPTQSGTQNKETLTLSPGSIASEHRLDEHSAYHAPAPAPSATATPAPAPPAVTATPPQGRNLRGSVSLQNFNFGNPYNPPQTTYQPYRVLGSGAQYASLGGGNYHDGSGAAGMQYGHAGSGSGSGFGPVSGFGPGLGPMSGPGPISGPMSGPGPTVLTNPHMSPAGAWNGYGYGYGGHGMSWYYGQEQGPPYGAW